MPKIDWSFYRSRISLPGLVDNFEKSVSMLTAHIILHIIHTVIDVFSIQYTYKIFGLKIIAMFRLCFD